MPPKKLTQAEKAIKAEIEMLRPIIREIRSIKAAMKTNDDMLTWRWAALEIVRTLQKDFDKNSPYVQRCKEAALALAREAQLAINFAG